MEQVKIEQEERKKQGKSRLEQLEERFSSVLKDFGYDSAANDKNLLIRLKQCSENHKFEGKTEAEQMRYQAKAFYDRLVEVEGQKTAGEYAESTELLERINKVPNSVLNTEVKGSINFIDSKSWHGAVFDDLDEQTKVDIKTRTHNSIVAVPHKKKSDFEKILGAANCSQIVEYSDPEEMGIVFKKTHGMSSKNLGERHK